MDKKRFLIGLDIGTSAVKGALVGEDARVICTKSAPFEYIIEGEGRFLDPEGFVSACESVIKALADVSPEPPSALCSCCASGNPVFLDENMKPLTPIIGWQTKVSQEDLDKVYTEKEQKDLYRVCGWPLGHGMPAANLAYLSVHEPEILKKTAFMAMSAEYLNFRLTGNWGLSHSMATPSYLTDQKNGVWNLPLIKRFGLDETKLPPIFPKGTVLGEVTDEAAQSLGLSRGAKVVLGTFDHPSGAMGAGVLEEGDLLLSCGTSWVELFPVPDRDFALSTGGLVDRFLIHGAPWCVMKSLTSVTEKINALREGFFGVIPHREFDGMVGEAPLGCGGLRFNFDADDKERAKGFEKHFIARAIIEGAALLLKENLEKLKTCGLRAERITAIGGITNSPICTRVLGEVIGQDVKTVNGQSAGAVGSALLAGMGIGLYGSEKEAFEKMSRAAEKEKH
ncbi:MAG: hypothetical protein IJV00_10470 [Clostridia bacterium]|nr:hypothetical protein [Clostridia bacterium]